MSRAVFTSQQKLTKPTDFKRVFKNPVVSSDACFRVLARRGDHSSARLGMAVSRKVDRKAVGRNRIKRVVRESFRKHFSCSPKRMDVIVLPRQETASICNRELFCSLQNHWVRLESRIEE